MATKTAISSSKKSTKKSSEMGSSDNMPSTAMASSLVSFNNKMKKRPIIGAMIAEFIGTFLLVAAIFAVQGQPLYIAFVLVGIVLLIGGVSGAYVNPAMAVGAWVTRKIKGLRAIGYIVAEILGAVVAWAILNSFLHGSESASLTSSQTLYHAATLTSSKEWVFFFAELLGTAILALGLAAAIRIKKNNITAAFSYGFAVLIALLVAGWVTSMSLTEANTGLSFLNPAVAAAAGGLKWEMWPIAVYIIAPAIGAILGFAIHDFLKSQTTEQSCDCGCECCDIKE
jgi:aquaporin Z